MNSFETTPKIRELADGDEPALARFFQENDREEITRHFHPFPLSAEMATRICRETRRDLYFASFEGETITAMGMLRGWDEGYAVPSFGVVVDHRRHGQGLGSRIIAHALELARARGAERVRLTVDGSRENVVALYERHGFRRTEELPGGRLVMMAELALPSAVSA
jgi:ribosomal protein S18 acetylase RimI-like enzyme